MYFLINQTEKRNENLSQPPKRTKKKKKIKHRTQNFAWNNQNPGELSKYNQNQSQLKLFFRSMKTKLNMQENEKKSRVELVEENKKARLKKIWRW